MGIYFDVPLCAQEKSMVCWSASAQMIWWYWQRVTGRAGPMNTLQEKYAKNFGVNAPDFIRLALTVGLRKVERSTSYTSPSLVSLLKKHGPLWCAGYWYGVPHIIVLTGVAGESVLLNDPDRGIKKIGTVSWFNQKLANDLDGCLMSKDPAAY